jgi:hypothetical protein
MLQVQYHGITDAANLDTWRGMSYQTVLTPADQKDRRSDLSLREGAEDKAVILASSPLAGEDGERFCVPIRRAGGCEREQSI